MTQFVPRSKHTPSRLQKRVRFDVWKKTGNLGLNVTLRGVRITIVAVRSNKWSECVFVALVIQHTVRMSRFILSSVAYKVLPFFYTLFHERRHFLGQIKGLLNVICRIWFSPKLRSLTFLILRRDDSNVINVQRFSRKVPAILCQILMNHEFS
jgi:hypothetical protein